MQLLTESRAGVTTSVTFAGTLVNAGLAFLITGLVSNGLGAAGTGAFFQTVAFFAIAASALSMGADTALVRGLSRALARDENPRIWPMILAALAPVLVVSVTAATLIWLAAPGLGPILYADEPAQGAHLVRVLAPFLPMTPLLAICLATTRGLGRVYPYTTIQNLLIPLTRTGLVALAVFTTAAVTDVLLAWAVPLAIGAAAAFPVMQRTRRRVNPAGTRPSQRSVGTELRPLWGFALPRGAASLVERGLEWADVLLVIHLAGPATGGVYAVVRRVMGLGALFESSIRVVVGPRVSQALAVADQAGFRAVFREATTMLVLCSWPLYLFLFVQAETVLSLFGPAFSQGSTALRIACVGMLLEVSGGMLQSSLLMGGRSHWQLMNKSVQLVILVVGVLVLVPSFGLTGAATAWLVACLTNLTLASNQVWRRMGARTSLTALAIPCLAAVGIFGVANALILVLIGPGLLALAVCFLTCVAAYVALCVHWRARIGLLTYWERT